MGDVISQSIHIAGDIYMGGDFEQLKTLALSGKVKED
eukprot:CAMPEP_0118707812 /NCGR_PEP_ID=MMETSP0800-20121206/21457_1 /TAXON_ID=210618 ORGANISM="Striatella unipunctata, Strain CCMP2910" /NCGR_SAMPLE_ID=MMETSP0800 /ASSEMBLY_ACC=CAM_ASM_000638 /LENGTH=36 /DNA_ID= /DNA_START= /DNA_END= /DNA_ORIENTATION=